MKKLKKIRIAVSLAFFLLLTAFFADVSGCLPRQLSVLEQIQFLPSLLSFNLGMVGFWLIASFLFGRVYCSTVCPMGTFQDFFGRLGKKIRKNKNARYRFSPAKNILRYSLLTMTAFSLCAGVVAFPALIDPYSAYGRIVVAFVRPLTAWIHNTAATDSTLLLSLGLQPWQVRSIYRYRAKGGIYRQPSDFARLYGLTVKQYKELLPYIHISDEYKSAAEVYGRTDAVRSGRDTLRYPVKLQPGQYVTLDDADTASLRKVPGIGRYYASRIVRYRNDLGGYVSVAQLSEIEGIPEAALSYFRLTGGAVRKLNLNRLTLNELKHHPYINFYQARRIIDYRRLKGPLHSINDLRLLKDFSQRDIERLRPYVEF